MNIHSKRFKSFRKQVKTKLGTAQHHKPKRFWSYIKSRRQDHIGIPTLVQNGNVLTSNVEKANSLSEQFQRVFIKEDLTNIPHMGESAIRAMAPIDINSNGILKSLKELNVEKACGPDLIPIRVMKYAAEEISPILEVIFT